MARKDTIEELFAFIIHDPAHGDGLLTRDTQAGRIPMVTTSREMLEHFRTDAMETALAMGMDFEPVKFTRVRESRT